MRITYITCIKCQKVLRICIWLFFSSFDRALSPIYSTLSIISLEYQHVSSCRSTFPIASGFRNYPVRRYLYVKRLRRLGNVGERNTWNFQRCFASPRELPVHSKRATSLSLRPNGITDIIVRGEREKRKSMEGRELHIHDNCRGWAAKCVGRSL